MFLSTIILLACIVVYVDEIHVEMQTNVYIYISVTIFLSTITIVLYIYQSKIYFSVSTVTYSYHCQAFEKGSGLTAVTAVDEHRPLDGD